MGLFDFLFGKSKNKVSSECIEQASNSDDDFVVVNINDDSNRKTFCYVDNDTIDLFTKSMLAGQMEVRIPKGEWKKACEKRREQDKKNYLIEKTAELNNKGIQYESENKIDLAIEVYEECIKLGYPATHSYERLMILYHKIKDTINEERIITLAIKKFPKNSKYQLRLSKLQGCHTEKLVTEAPKIKVDIKWGELLYRRIADLPEFDFYCEQNTNPEKYNWLYTSSYQEILKPIYEITDHFKLLLDNALTAENLGDLPKAAQLYEQAVAEKYFMPKPYERLIIIYRKSKLIEDEIRILKIAIEHFNKPRETQYVYIMELAKKYGAVQFTEERIQNNKKITYYSGTFELYNPFTVVNKWKEKLNKLTENK